jgi:hypothetical protein
VQLVIRDVLVVQADAPDRTGSAIPVEALTTVADRIPRARLEQALTGVDDVRRALSQPINGPLALAAVYARVGLARRREAVTA